jgi:hypothetical protein
MKNFLVALAIFLVAGASAARADAPHPPPATPLEKSPPATEAGTKAEVEWNGVWFPAQVIRTLQGRYYIHYENYGEEWDEWVGKDRIRFPENKPEQKVEVIWGEQWWPATVLRTMGRRYYIHYTGWGDDWDEWVGQDRIYFPTPKAAPSAPREESPGKQGTGTGIGSEKAGN